MGRLAVKLRQEKLISIRPSNRQPLDGCKYNSLFYCGNKIFNFEIFSGRHKHKDNLSIRLKEMYKSL